MKWGRFCAVLATAGMMYSVAISAGAVLGASPAMAEEKTEITISRQRGFQFVISDIMQKQGLVEKQAAALGVTDLKVNWISFTSGGAQTDAMLAGSVDVVNTGIGNLLLLWDRTKGKVKGITGTAAQPFYLITRNPKLNSLKDFGPDDKIAVPTIGISTQAILLQMAAAQTFGDDQWSRLNSNMVQLGHPDAAAALNNPQHEVTSHFSSPPYDYYEMKTVPGARIILNSKDIIGGPLTVANYFTMTKFADENPKLVLAIKAATLEAIDYIHKDTRGAVDIYRELSGDKTSADELMDMLSRPGMMDFIAAPQGTMKFAKFLYKIGVLKTEPTAWTDYYLSASSDLNGN